MPYSVVPCFLLRISRRDGQGEIRTHDTLTGTPVFETGAFNHSATCPAAQKLHRNPSNYPSGTVGSTNALLPNRVVGHHSSRRVTFGPAAWFEQRLPRRSVLAVVTGGAGFAYWIGSTWPWTPRMARDADRCT